LFFAQISSACSVGDLVSGYESSFVGRGGRLSVSAGAKGGSVFQFVLPAE